MDSSEGTLRTALSGKCQLDAVRLPEDGSGAPGRRSPWSDGLPDASPFDVRWPALGGAGLPPSRVSACLIATLNGWLARPEGLQPGAWRGLVPGSHAETFTLLSSDGARSAGANFRTRQPGAGSREPIKPSGVTDSEGFLRSRFRGFRFRGSRLPLHRTPTKAEAGGAHGSCCIGRCPCQGMLKIEVARLDARFVLINARARVGKDGAMRKDD